MIIAFYTTQCIIIYKVLSHTLLQADRENPADRWGDGGIQANQTEEREGGQSEREADSLFNLFLKTLVLRKSIGGRSNQG